MERKIPAESSNEKHLESVGQHYKQTRTVSLPDQFMNIVKGSALNYKVIPVISTLMKELSSSFQQPVSSREKPIAVIKTFMHSPKSDRGLSSWCGSFDTSIYVIPLNDPIDTHRKDVPDLQIISIYNPEITSTELDESRTVTTRVTADKGVSSSLSGDHSSATSRVPTEKGISSPIETANCAHPLATAKAPSKKGMSYPLASTIGDHSLATANPLSNKGMHYPLASTSETGMEVHIESSSQKFYEATKAGAKRRKLDEVKRVIKEDPDNKTLGANLNMHRPICYTTAPSKKGMSSPLTSISGDHSLATAKAFSSKRIHYPLASTSGAHPLTTVKASSDKGMSYPLASTSDDHSLATVKAPSDKGMKCQLDTVSGDPIINCHCGTMPVTGQIIKSTNICTLIESGMEVKIEISPPQKFYEDTNAWAEISKLDGVRWMIKEDAVNRSSRAKLNMHRPKCHSCGNTFSKQANLKRHIILNRCNAIKHNKLMQMLHSHNL